MKKLLAILVAIGFALTLTTGADVAASDPEDYDDFPIEVFH